MYRLVTQFYHIVAIQAETVSANYLPATAVSFRQFIYIITKADDINDVFPTVTYN